MLRGGLLYMKGLASGHLCIRQEEEHLPVELFQTFVEKIDSLGPYGPFLFMGAVVCAELIPLFPTQPLCLASGLLFGPKMGAIYILSSTLFAATISFSLAKGIGRSLAERLVKQELKGGESSNSIGAAFTRVQATIEQGNFWQQFSAVLALRMTPVVPFSAANYLLGLTPLKFPAYMGASFLGMTLWATLYASIGGASRELLRSGVKFDVLLADVAGRASAYTEDAAIVALVLGVIVAAFWLARYMRNQVRRHGLKDTGHLPGSLSEDEKLERVKDRV
ncbi:hypothetical protein WJX72_003101 [[Myrmecia] bisecta]|uniref:VTT domain-containing protein n=1 Tax=[Myrmecia] bisecta TaxID=41462 RepID=A0AAW1QPR8_9CHLO